MIAYYLIVAVFIVLYHLTLFYWRPKLAAGLSDRLTHRIRLSHFIGMALCAFIFYINQYHKLDLRGLWTSRVIIMVSILLGLIAVFAQKEITGKLFTRFYFKGLSVLPLIFGILMLIPLIGLFFHIFLFRLINPTRKIYYNDEKIRIQYSERKFLAPPSSDVYKHSGMFDQYLGKISGPIDSLKVAYEHDSIRVYRYTSDDNSVHTFPNE